MDESGKWEYREGDVPDLEEMIHQPEAELIAEPSPEDRIAELERQNQILTDCILEMSQIIYA